MNQIYKSIHDVLGDYLIETLTQKLMVESADPIFTPMDVAYGNLQDNPAKKRICVRIHENDIDQQSDVEPHWSDLPANETQEWNMYPDGEVGGKSPAFWARRQVVEILVYLTSTKEDRIDARMIGNYVSSAAISAITGCGCCSGTEQQDDFGETLLQLKACRHVIVEGGGKGNFIYRAKIYVSALTEML